MDNPYIVFNIETARDPETPESLVPQFDMPDKSSFSAPSNYKDQTKIDDYIERAYQSAIQDSKQKVEEDLNKMGLSPLTGRIVCLSMITSWQPYPDVNVVHGDEEKCLKMFVEEIKYCLGEHKRIYPRLVGYNSKTFDLPYIMLSALKYKISIPLHQDYLRRYDYRSHFDVYDFIASNLSHRKGTLGDWGERFIGRRPWGKGDQVQGWVDQDDWESITKHCNSNVNVTHDLFKLFSSYLPL